LLIVNITFNMWNIYPNKKEITFIIFENFVFEIYNSFN
jgi:hypothetical protein